jgi:hypothetical protein
MKSRILKLAAFATCLALGASMALAFGEQTFVRTIEVQTTFVRRTATEYQRKVAERNREIFNQKITPAKKLELRKKNVRTVLIRTVPGPHTPPGAVDYMRFPLDVTESLIDDNAYEFQPPLEAGTIAQVKGLQPQFVGQ